MKRRLLCTDLDGTLIPNGAAVESPRARELFRVLAERGEVTLVYVTGRHHTFDRGSHSRVQTATSRIRHWRCRDNDIRSVIHKLDSKQEMAKNSSHWLAGDSVTMLRNQLATVDELTLQEPSKQNRFKVWLLRTAGSQRKRSIDDCQELCPPMWSGGEFDLER